MTPERSRRSAGIVLILVLLGGSTSIALTMLVSSGESRLKAGDHLEGSQRAAGLSELTDDFVGELLTVATCLIAYVEDLRDGPEGELVMELGPSLLEIEPCGVDSPEWVLPAEPLGSIVISDAEEDEQAALWAALAPVGTDVVVGIGSSDEVGSYKVYWAIEVDGLGGMVGMPIPTSGPYEPQLQAFADWSLNPFSTLSVRELVTAWNVEVNASPPGTENYDGPIQLSWQHFVERVILGAVDWMELPPEQRSLDDAPELLTETLQYAEVWMVVSDGWRSFEGAVCLTTSEGSNGCFFPGVLEDGQTLIDLNGWAVTGEDIIIAAHPLDRRWTEPVARWEGAIEIGRIPFPAVIETGIVLVTLSPVDPPSSYEDLKDRVLPVPLATGAAVSSEILLDLLEAQPTVEPEPCEEC